MLILSIFRYIVIVNICQIFVTESVFYKFTHFLGMLKAWRLHPNHQRRK